MMGGGRKIGELENGAKRGGDAPLMPAASSPDELLIVLKAGGISSTTPSWRTINMPII
jgi:hypothetical protein